MKVFIALIALLCLSGCESRLEIKHGSTSQDDDVEFFHFRRSGKVVRVNGTPMVEHRTILKNLPVGKVGYVAPEAYDFDRGDPTSGVVDLDAEYFETPSEDAVMRVKRVEGGYEVDIPKRHVWPHYPKRRRSYLEAPPR